MARANFPAIALLLALVAGPAQSVRNARLDMAANEQTASEGSPKPKKTSRGVLVGPGWVCEDVQYLRKSKDAAEVKQYMTDRGLSKDYQLLKGALAKAKAGMWAPWDGSVLSREISFGNPSKAFGAMSLDVFLIVPYIYTPEYKLCFAQRNVSIPGHVAAKRYSDGSVVLAKCYDEYKNMPAGTAAQSYDDRIVRTARDALPVEVLKLLLSKDAMDLHATFANEINGYDHKSRSSAAATTAATTLMYEARFQAKGLGVYYNHYTKQCYNGGSFTDIEHQWFEYVDLDAVALPFKQTFRTNAEDTRFPTVKLLRHLRCKAPPPQPSARPAIFRLREEMLPLAPGCSQVDQAIPRKHTEGACKCPYEFRVYCNGTFAAGRKFRMGDLSRKSECTAADMYCAPPGCKHNMYRRR